jgi:hypothetical protein
MAKYDPDWEAKAAAAKKARAPMRAAKRKATQAQRKTTRSPGGWAGGSTVSTVENYNDQVKRKYGGGKL